MLLKTKVKYVFSCCRRLDIAVPVGHLDVEPANADRKYQKGLLAPINILMIFNITMKL